MSKLTALLATGLLAVGLAGSAFAQQNISGNITTGTSASSPLAVANYDCNSLYSADTNDVYRIDNPATSAASTMMYRPQGFSGTGYYPSQPSTIALGYRYGKNAEGIPLDENGNPDPNQKLVMYHWWWQENGNATTGGKSRIGVVVNGESQWTLMLAPSNTDGTGYQYWSGGEVEQRTGRIFFSGGEDSTLGNNFRMMLYNPRTGETIRSGNDIGPASAADKLPSTSMADAYVASDMAVDAEGNAYILVGNANKKLVRIVPGGDLNGTWKYNIVTPITGTIPPGTDLWGMAFLNGALYVRNGVNTATTSLYKIDVLSGQSTAVPGNPGGGQFDLATCQTAPVIAGVVRNDPKGDGTGTGVAGVTVDIYKEENGVPVYRGSRTTSGNGDYSFILDSTDAVFYIRVRQPQINGLNATQSWAGVGGTRNISSAFCYDDNGVTREVTTSGLCRGVRPAGSDPAVNDLSKAQIYGKVKVTTDMEVGHIDFGLSVVSSYGDAASTTGIGTPPASSGYRVLRAQGGPAHNTFNKSLWLGDTVGT
ncbi:MAG: hypothetical protein FWC42_09450, partial [Proteobacteria bacterium]|nr:hypothetical protein [Pseudomonadota bacterium]